LEKYAQAEKDNDIATMIALQQAIRFNGGGHINHSIFWTNLAPIGKGGGEMPKEELAKIIVRDFGSLDGLIEKMSTTANGVQGSGWAWLGYCKKEKRLHVTSCPNQDPLSITGFTPLLGLDVWEHAYYLQYKNVRADYVKNIWKIVYWKNIEERFQKAIS
jgi:Fe-Mn family superoxide dismutase